MRFRSNVLYLQSLMQAITSYGHENNKETHFYFTPNEYH